MFVNFCLVFMPVVAIILIYVPGLNRAIFLERLQYVSNAARLARSLRTLICLDLYGGCVPFRSH